MRSIALASLYSLTFGASLLFAQEGAPTTPPDGSCNHPKLEDIIRAECGEQPDCRSLNDHIACVARIILSLPQTAELDQLRARVMQPLNTHRAFCDGFEAALQNAPECRPPQPTPTEGDGSNDGGDEGAELTLEEARDQVAADCSCEQAKNHGQYVRCVGSSIKALLASASISKDDAKTLQSEASHSICGKKNEKKKNKTK